MHASLDHIYGLDLPTFHSIIDAQYDEVLVYDANYSIVYINKACTRHYGCTPEAMIGKSFFDFVDKEWWTSSILPVVYEQKKIVAARQKTYIGSELLTIATPIFDTKGKLQYVVMNVRDVVNDNDLYNPQYSLDEPQARLHFVPISESDEMRHIMQLLDKIRNLDVTCILTGESGTGKSMLAKYLHAKSQRAEQPFISLNCASIPASLLESELFGYARGAFTGARPGGKKGLLELAHQGTLLLDEVSELSLAAQAKLLHFLQDKEFFPVGGNTAVRVDVRIIAATNKNLRHMVESGQFREDLFYRLNVVEVYIPPLRKRRDDILPLVHYFLNLHTSKYGLSRQFSPEALAILLEAEWKGNVRELAHLVERLVVTSDTVELGTSQLPKSMFGISDFSDGLFSLQIKGKSLEEKMHVFEGNIVREAWQKCGSSRKVAEYLAISQTKANNLIRKHVPKQKPQVDEQ